jgi:hypothetical protein
VFLDLRWTKLGSKWWWGFCLVGAETVRELEKSPGAEGKEPISLSSLLLSGLLAVFSLFQKSWEAWFPSEQRREWT